MSPLKEILYVDNRRLESYVEQIRSPVTTDTIPTWTVELSLTNLKFSKAHTKPTRPLTINEQINTLTEYLHKTNNIESGRPSTFNSIHLGSPFRSESCIATRIFLPPKKDDTAAFPGLTIWISYGLDHPPQSDTRGPTKPGLLFLMEDDPYGDNKWGITAPVSAYSALLLLNCSIEPQLEKTIAGSKLLLSRAESSFANDPIGELSNLGARVLYERQISILYRIRTGTVVERANNYYETVTFGYPIFVIDGTV